MNLETYKIKAEPILKRIDTLKMYDATFGLNVMQKDELTDLYHSLYLLSSELVK